MKNSIIVIGAGGHAKVCVEILRDMGRDVAFCVGNVGGPQTCVGVIVLAGDENLSRLRAEGFSQAFVAVGSNRLRQKLAAEAVDLGYELVNAISPKANLSPSVVLGKGVAIMAGVCVNAEAVIADLAIVNTGATVDHDCIVGVAAHIAPQSGIAGNVTIGDRAFIGIGSRIIPERTIGHDTMVGAGSVIIHDIPPLVTVVGVPSKVIQTIVNREVGA